MQLGRELLGIGDKEFIVSKVNSRFGLVHDNKIEKIPSFFSAMRNIPAIALEPFRRRTEQTGTDLSLHDFISNRFGKRFATKYSSFLTLFMNGQSSAEHVSVHSLLPRMARNFFSHKSVLLGPLLASLKTKHNHKGDSFTNVMDHLWQELMSGGKYVSLLPDLCLFPFFDRLNFHINSISRECTSRIGRIDAGQIVCEDGSKHAVDLIISSIRPDLLAALFPTSGPIPDLAALTSYKTMHATRFVWEKSAIATLSVPPVLVTDSIGTVVIQSSLFEVPNGTDRVIIDVLSNKAITLDDFRESTKSWITSELAYLISTTPDATSHSSEDIPASGLGTNDALRQFNKWRIATSKSLMIDIQVVGKWYYTNSCSLSDVVADAHYLATILSERYETFPSKENELSSHWMERSDRSLDYSYQQESMIYRTKL
jgi:protoporphyrinogen oxidase